MLLEIFSELPLQTPDNIVDNAQFFNTVLNTNKDLLPKTTWHSYKAPLEWIFSEWISSYKTRLNKTSSEAQIFRNTQGSTLPTIFNEALSAYFRAVDKDIQTFAGYRPLMTAQLAKDLQNLDGFCQLSDRSRLISDVDSLIQTINTSPTGQYYQTMKADLEAFKVQCLQVN
jgi:hypothetical protein